MYLATKRGGFPRLNIHTNSYKLHVKPRLKREKEEEEGLGEGNRLKANREIDILA